MVDGPFSETKELVAGFWIVQVKSKEEAIEWMKRAPFREGEVEIRQVFEAEDFGAEYTPELRAQEERQRAQIAGAAEAEEVGRRDMRFMMLMIPKGYETGGAGHRAERRAGGRDDEVQRGRSRRPACCSRWTACIRPRWGRGSRSPAGSRR